MDKFYMVIDVKIMRIVNVSKDIALAGRYLQELTDEWWRFSGTEPDLHLYEVKEIN